MKKEITKYDYNYLRGRVLRTGHRLTRSRKKIEIDFPDSHVIPRKEVLKNLKDNSKENYVAWIGHATFLIKLGDTTIITDPLFSKNTGPLIFGPKRYVDPAIKLNEFQK